MADLQGGIWKNERILGTGQRLLLRGTMPGGGGKSNKLDQDLSNERVLVDYREANTFTTLIHR